jgi:DNA polymerase-3 subunit delta'
MPFQSSEIIERFEVGLREKRLAHAYLVTGSNRDQVLGLVEHLAGLVLKSSPGDHPDFYKVQPESKSRRIRIEQIRELERSLYLKSMKSEYKVAVILDADRMCLGQAEAANAFLKTLEEPPVKTILFLTSTQPQGLLATIISRCIKLDLVLDENSGSQKDEMWESFIAEWKSVSGSPAVRAYRRSQLLSELFAELRLQIQDSFETALKEADDEETENAVKALIESEFLSARGELMIRLQQWYWKEALDESGLPNRPDAVKGLMFLSELQNTLQTNVDTALSIERSMLAIEGAISAGWK